jgi:hypothetical protein
MIARIARQDGRDAVFDVPAQVIRSAPADVLVIVSLADDPNVTARGRIRQVGASRSRHPDVRGQGRFDGSSGGDATRCNRQRARRVETNSGPVINIPASALTRMNQQPAVWVVDPATNMVSTRNVVVLRFDRAQVIVSRGLDDGDVVVTAGVQALYPGQKVRVLGSEP